MSRAFQHLPVMPNEVIGYLSPLLGKTVVDTTAGGGGHLSLLAQSVGEKGRILAFDRDPRAHQADAALGIALAHKNIKLFHRSFSRIEETLKEEGITQIDRLLCDLGVSSHQLDESARGFSFMNDGPIDMRMDTTRGLSAYQWLEQSSEQDIADALFHFGEERKSRAVARLIKKSWPIENSTLALAQLVLSALRQRSWSKIHPATRSFQAIRMAVNEEIPELKKLLAALPKILAVDGIAVFLSFHSLEDRLIKHSFKELVAQSKTDLLGPKFAVLTKKPVIAQEGEIKDNRRARSAKLRVLLRQS